MFLIENEYRKLNSSDSNFDILNCMKSIFMEARLYLDEALKNEATNFLYKSAIKVFPDRTFFADFIGLADRDRFWNHKPNYDDALFSTAQAINILIATWTHQNPDSKQLVWKKHTPVSVKDLVNSSVNWLADNVLGSKYKPHNAFFSGSDKGHGTLPLSYPTNFMQFLNGTNVTDPGQVKPGEFLHLINGVRGFIDEKTYQKMLTEPHFGERTPLDFHGYNYIGNFFPFWSSQPYTYAVSLLALAQFNNLEH